MTLPAGPGVLLGGRYRIVSELARGGMASVWVAEDTLLGRRVAVKTLHPDLAVDEAVRERFSREAVAAATLNHPNIVTTYDTGSDEGVSFIVMELVAGMNLRKLLNEHGPLPVAGAVRAARDVAAALQHAHLHDIVHRDIKPANVLVQPTGLAKVTDFGIAKAGDDLGDLTRTGTVVGTARYLSPEQLNGDPVDSRTDLYALGLLIHEMLTGAIPFTGDTELAAAVARLTRDPASLIAARPDVPPVLDQLVRRLLARRPDDRLGSAAEARSVLERIAGTGSLPTVAPPGGPRGNVRPGAASRDSTGPGTNRSGASRPAAAGPAAGSRSGTRAPDGPRGGPTRPGAPQQRNAGRPPGPVRAGAPPGNAARGPSRPPGRPPAPAPHTGNAARSVAIAVLVVVVLVAGAAVGYLAARGSDGSTTPPGPKISGAVDFDPDGRDGEHPEETQFAIDGDATTGWSTEHYASRDLTGKEGVGLRVDLARDVRVRRVVVDTLEGDWNATLFLDDSAGTTLADWGAAVATITGSGTRASFSLPPDAHGSTLLVWITRVPQSGRLVVLEVRVS